MTEFEKYLQNKKKEMDLKEVNPKIWEGIENEMEIPKTKDSLTHLQDLSKKETKGRPIYHKVLGMAAVFLLGIIFSQVFFTAEKVVIPAELLASYGFEDQAVDLVLEKQLQLIRESSVPVGHKNDLQILVNQVQYLDETFQSKVDYLNEKGYAENIAKEVLQYYKSKSELLDKVIFEIQKINENEKEFNINSEKSKLSI